MKSIDPGSEKETISKPANQTCTETTSCAPELPGKGQTGIKFAGTASYITKGIYTSLCPIVSRLLPLAQRLLCLIKKFELIKTRKTGSVPIRKAPSEFLNMMNWQYTPFTIPLLALGFGTAALAYYVFRNRRNAPEAQTLILLIAVVSAWCFSYAAELASVDFAVKAIWAKIEYLSISTIPTAWLLLALQYTKREKWITRRNLALLALHPLIIICLVWTNDIHHLIWRWILENRSGSFVTRDLVHGPVFWVHVIYSYILSLFGTVLILLSLFRSRHIHQGQASILLVGVLAPWLGNFLYLCHLNPFPTLDLTPFGFAISCVGCVFGMLRFGFLDIIPVARDAVVESMDDAVLVLDVKNRVVDVNPAAEKTLRSGSSMELGTPIETALADFPDLVQRCCEGAEKVAEIVLEKDERQQHFDVHISPLRQSGGKEVGKLVVMRDVTFRMQLQEELRRHREYLEEKVQERTQELKIANQHLQENKEEHRLFFENISDCIYCLDTEMRATSISPSVERLLGYKPEELIGRPFPELNILAPEYHERAVADTLVVFSGNRINSSEYEFIAKNGGRRTGSVSGAPLWKDGKVVGVLSVARDITDKRNLEQQLLHSQKMETIGTLAGGIAHDFNNLLAGVLGYASLMKSRIPPDHEFFRYLETVEKSAMRASELTAQLLGFARGGKYQIRTLDLNRIVEESVELLRRTFDKSIEIETNLKACLPAIEADGGQIQQVIMNLCVNAKDAMRDEGKLLVETDNVVLREDYVSNHIGAKPGSYVLLSVTDTGSGMTKEVLARIFEPFFTTKENGKGTGLGLAMAYGVVKNHGGHICVYSEPGHGSTFKVYLPTNGAPVAEEKAVQCKTAKFGQESILVVDDEDMMRSLIRDILENHGYRVFIAENGVEATAIYRENSRMIDLVLLDMIMPKMGGHETFLKLKEINPTIKAILSTGYSQNGKARDIIESGVAGFIQKPYYADRLLATIRSVLDNSQQARTT